MEEKKLAPKNQEQETAYAEFVDATRGLAAAERVMATAQERYRKALTTLNQAVVKEE